MLHYLWWFLLGYLIWQLVRQLFGIKTFVRIQVRPPNQVDGLLVPSDLGKVQQMPESGFLALAKARFVQISSAFSSGQIQYIQHFISPKVYDVFNQIITQRKSLGHSVDFRLVDFKKVNLTLSDDGKSCWVDFLTEQVNLLKDKLGQVIEGDPMYVSSVHEKWQFTWDEKSGWLLTAIQSLDTHAI